MSHLPMSKTYTAGDLKIVYSKNYNISFFGIERLHPFDSKKYGRTWELLQKQFKGALSSRHITVDRPVSDEELLLVHTPEYLQSLRSSKNVAMALEIPMLRLLPHWLLAWRVLRPMRWAVRGSVMAAKAALQCGAVVNLSGGYHHAKPSQGEGFCVFSDIALMVQQLRHEKQLQTDDTVLYVDLDAHQGNGVCHQFISDQRVSIFDMYDKDIYPKRDFEARDRIDCDIPLPFNCLGSEYLGKLRQSLPPFLDGLAKTNPRLAIYNAGTDVYSGDELGGLCLCEADVLERDLFVIRQFRNRGIPFVMLLSGGYSKYSYRLVANTVARLLQDEEFSSPHRPESNL
jgi:histone deacetylase 11